MNNIKFFSSRLLTTGVVKTAFLLTASILPLRFKYQNYCFFVEVNTLCCESQETCVYVRWWNTEFLMLQPVAHTLAFILRFKVLRYILMFGNINTMSIYSQFVSFTEFWELSCWLSPVYWFAGLESFQGRFICARCCYTKQIKVCVLRIEDGC